MATIQGYLPGSDCKSSVKAFEHAEELQSSYRPSLTKRMTTEDTEVHEFCCAFPLCSSVVFLHVLGSKFSFFVLVVCLLKYGHAFLYKVASLIGALGRPSDTSTSRIAPRDSISNWTRDSPWSSKRRTWCKSSSGPEMGSLLN